MVLVGSSLGGMISIKMGDKFESRIAAMVLIAPAVNTLRGKFQMWYDSVFDDEARTKLDRGEVHIFEVK